MTVQRYITSGSNTGRKRYAKIVAATGVVMTTNAPWPNAVDDEPVIGDDGTYIYLPVKEDVNDGIFDPNRFSIEHGSAPSADGTFFHLKHETKERSKEEMEERVKNARKFNDSTLVPMADVAHPSTLVLAALIRGAKGIDPTSIEQEAIDTVLANASKLAVNEAREKELLEDVAAGRDFDLDVGFEKKE